MSAFCIIKPNGRMSCLSEKNKMTKQQRSNINGVTAGKTEAAATTTELVY